MENRTVFLPVTLWFAALFSAFAGNYAADLAVGFVCEDFTPSSMAAHTHHIFYASIFVASIYGSAHIANRLLDKSERNAGVHPVFSLPGFLIWFFVIQGCILAPIVLLTMPGDAAFYAGLKCNIDLWDEFSTSPRGNAVAAFVLAQSAGWVVSFALATLWSQYRNKKNAPTRIVGTSRRQP